MPATVHEARPYPCAVPRVGERTRDGWRVFKVRLQFWGLQITWRAIDAPEVAQA